MFHFSFFFKKHFQHSDSFSYLITNLKKSVEIHTKIYEMVCIRKKPIVKQYKNINRISKRCENKQFIKMFHPFLVFKTAFLMHSRTLLVLTNVQAFNVNASSKNSFILIKGLVLRNIQGYHIIKKRYHMQR